MDRLWHALRDSYARMALLPAGKTGRNKKIIGPDSKLKEPEDLCTVTTKDIVHDIIDGKPASDNLEDALL